MHYYQFNISDFSQSTKHLTLIEKAVYRELIDIYYDKEKPLINDPKELARLISARDNVTTVEQTLNEFFTLVDDCWVNDRCEEVISEYQSKIQGASKAGKASAKARAAKLETSSDVTTVEQTLNDSSTNQELLTNNYKPITINQEPTLKDKEKTKRSQFKKPTQQEILNYLIELKLDTNQATNEANKILNHYESNGWRVGKNKMESWKAATRGWLSRSNDYKPNQPVSLKDIDYGEGRGSL